MPKQIMFPGCTLEDLEAEAIGFIREHEPQEGYFVGFSGGKDSLVLLDLVKRSGVKFEAWHSLTSIDPPEVVHFVRSRYPEVNIAKPAESVYKLIIKKGPPKRIARWCCDELKKKPTFDDPHKVRLMGIRAEESVRRASRPRIDNYKNKQAILKPIFAWKEWAVWEYIEKYGIEYPALYDQGFERIGCVCCPFIFSDGPSNRHEREESQRRWPSIWRAYKNACRKWHEQKNRIGHKDFEVWWDAYITGKPLIEKSEIPIIQRNKIDALHL